MKIVFTSILLLLTLHSFSQNCSDCRYADSLELVKLYNATDGGNWTNKWDLAQPMNTWYSATQIIKNDRVTFIDLQQNGLNGTIPNLNLPKLQELFLSDYNLAGSLPNFNLPALQMLFITNSQVSGTLPNFNLPNLQSLAVAGCPFITGTIPAFNNMPNLRQLTLSGNQLSGNIPNFTQSFTSLQLGGNLLSGAIPNFSMPNLTTLELDGNQLTGSIPNLNLAKLQYLSLANNQLNGAIPELHLPALLSLNAGFNKLSGALPSFNYLPLLNVLVLSNNQLSGSAPNFGSKSPLYTIDLVNNQLTGSIPAYNLSLLVNLFLGNNQLTGTIPSFQLPKLQGLSLPHNQLSGAIPNFNLPVLTALVLDSNQLTGAIPNFNLPELQYLHLNSNQLSGSIPAFNLPYLQSLLLNNNQLTGCIPGAIKTNSPDVQFGGDISNNPGLATQSWSDYWNNSAGVCQPPPTASVLTADQLSICSGSSTALRVTITGGNAPYTVVYSIGKAPNNTRFTITNYASGAAIPVSPTANTTYDLVSVTDATSNTGTGNSGAPTITVTQPITWYLDADRDKYYISSVLSCTSPGPGYSNKGTPGDCDDNNAAVHPNATEICDGVDNNCDGQVDEGFPTVNYYRDADGDGYGTPNDVFPAKCSAPAGYVSAGNDCDDNNAAVHPGAVDDCDGIDNDCDGQVDEDGPLVTYYFDVDGDGYGSPDNPVTTRCFAPANLVTNNLDCNDQDANVHPGAAEICNGMDDDCDGQVDEDFPFVTYYADIDGDGYGGPNNPVQAKCGIPTNTVTNNLDCDDQNANVHPGATEVCNGIDDDCDGQIDEDFPLVTYYFDVDGDGYGSPNNPVQARCFAPQNTVSNNLDCNDQDASVHPGATEICGNGIDDNCNGQVDEGFSNTTYYRDADGDGYGNPAIKITAKCTAPAGYVASKTDCNDNDASIHPGATEICDGIDNNCNGRIDEGFPLITYYADADGDGYGDKSVMTTSRCTVPAGYVTNRTDCNDNNAAIHPGATEICDGIDNNCNGQIDEGFPLITYYKDADGDGYGDKSVVTTSRCTPPAGYVTNRTDCNDNNAAVYPGATEICDGIDNNCNGQIDEVCNINISITIADKAKNEGNGQSKLTFAVTLDKTPKEAVQVDYTTQNITATAGSDYVAQTGTLTFAPGVKKQTISITINGDRVVEPDETFRIVLSNAVKAAIADDEAIGTITNDDGALSRAIVSATAATVPQAISVKVSPNPATSVLHVQLSGYKGNVTLQLCSLEGKVLKQEKLNVSLSKSPQQKINVASLAGGMYILTAIDEKGNRQSEKVFIAH